jgi:hypothetical protein
MFNSILGNFPFLKDIFVGEEGGGVFAINYTLVGPLDDPVVTVNPLSVMAPGFLRKLFRLDSLEPADDEAQPGDEQQR